MVIAELLNKETAVRYLNDEESSRVMAIEIFRKLDSIALLEFVAVFALPSPNDVPQRIVLLVLVQDDVTLARVEMTKLFFGYFDLQ